MKGVETWILVIGGIILGSIIFFAGVQIILNNIMITEKQNAIQQIATLYDKIQRTCLVGGIGETYYYTITLPEYVRAVYVAKYDEEEPPDKVSVFISEKRVANGTYFCYQFFNELPKCKKIECNTTMSYIGSPSLKDDLFSLLGKILGSTPKYEYKILINKTDYHNVIAVTDIKVLEENENIR